jgi:predicted  nucleic acid-binding Zn-ribbon protein
MMRDIRLGDDIDDFCVRCKRVMNHNVVSVLNGQAAKVRCRTCHSDHDFRHEQAPPPKVDARKAALFNEVLKKVAPGDARAAVEDVELDILPELDGESDVETDGEAGAEVEAEPEPVEVVELEPKPKKGRGRPRK